MICFFKFFLCVGEIYFISLFDEEQLVACDSPKKLLRYKGEIYVRDLALMLEEILYYYRPHGEIINSDELYCILSSYDNWVTKAAVPGDPEIFNAGNLAVAYEGFGPRKGTFQQLKLVSNFHLSSIAEKIRLESAAVGSAVSSLKVATSSNAESRRIQQTSINNNTESILIKTRGLHSARWSDVRWIIDSEQHNLKIAESEESGNKSPKYLSVHARAKLKLRRVRIADATVSFQKFARWLHTVLKRLAIIQIHRINNASSATSSSQGNHILRFNIIQ